MKSRTIFIFLLFVSFFLIPQVIAADGPAARTLEIVYPQIPGVPTPEYVSFGLPKYVNYIFRFSVIVIGILIFGVLVYSGTKYLLSFGNPTKLSEAKQGITAALFGGLILLGAYLIFNTINPQLLILTPPEIGRLKAYIVPGVYICNYNLDENGYNIGDILIKYMGSNVELRTEAAKRLREAMGRPGSQNVCFLASFSGLLTNFVISANSTNRTLFIIPSEEYDSETRTYGWIFNHGIVFHENDKFGDKCKVFPTVSGTTLYRQIDASDFHPQLGFTAKSITVFSRPSWPPPPEAKGVTLYEGPAFNEIGRPEEEETEVPPLLLSPMKPFSSLFSPFFALAEIDPNLIISPSLKPAGDNDILIVRDLALQGMRDPRGRRNLYHNTRSIKIEPKDGYIAVLFGNGGQKCEVRRTDDANLMDDPIGRCGNCNLFLVGRILNWAGIIDCTPCLESLYVIKGQVL